MSYGNDVLDQMKWELFCTLYQTGISNLSENDINICNLLLKDKYVKNALFESINKTIS